MKRQTKLTSGEEQQARSQSAEQQTQRPAPLEFATPEQLLRFDAARTAVPDSIARRLGQSTGETPQPRRSWWRRILGS